MRPDLQQENQDQIEEKRIIGEQNPENLQESPFQAGSSVDC